MNVPSGPPPFTTQQDSRDPSAALVASQDPDAGGAAPENLMASAPVIGPATCA